jgi:hypothetical protein
VRPLFHHAISDKNLGTTEDGVIDMIVLEEKIGSCNFDVSLLWLMWIACSIMFDKSREGYKVTS